MLDCRDLTIHSVKVDGRRSTPNWVQNSPSLANHFPFQSPQPKVSVEYTTSRTAAFLWVEGDGPFLLPESSDFGENLGPLSGQSRRSIHVQCRC